MHAASTEGRILQRPLFFDFPEDHAVVTVDDQFMFGDDIVVAPVLCFVCARAAAFQAIHWGQNEGVNGDKF